jgi:hypothetical protein
VVTSVLVLPFAEVQDAVPEDGPVRVLSTKEVERCGVGIVLAAEQALGRVPVEQAFNNPQLRRPLAEAGHDPIRIDVKARLAGADDFNVTHNEVITALNSALRYRLALVRVDPHAADLYSRDDAPHRPVRRLAGDVSRCPPGPKSDPSSSLQSIPAFRLPL